MKNGCILRDDQARFIYKVSFLCLISTSYALHRKHYDMALVPGGVFLTSINYWRRPDYSWRRYVDMSYVSLAISYQLLRARNAEMGFYYYLFTFSALLCYPFGVNFYNKKMYWASVYAHCMLHVFANVANVYLYSGHIVPVRCDLFGYQCD